MSENAGRRGARWRKLRGVVFNTWGDTCHLCGHPGAGDIDHLVPKADGGDPWNPANLRPAHGSLSRCPICKRCCNQVRSGQRTQALRRARRFPPRPSHTRNDITPPAAQPTPNSDAAQPRRAINSRRW